MAIEEIKERDEFIDITCKNCGHVCGLDETNNCIRQNAIGMYLAINYIEN